MCHTSLLLSILSIYCIYTKQCPPSMQARLPLLHGICFNREDETRFRILASLRISSLNLQGWVLFNLRSNPGKFKYLSNRIITSILLSRMSRVYVVQIQIRPNSFTKLTLFLFSAPPKVPRRPKQRARSEQYRRQDIPGHFINIVKLRELLEAMFGRDYKVELREDTFSVFAGRALSEEEIINCW